MSGRSGPNSIRIDCYDREPQLRSDNPDLGVLGILGIWRARPLAAGDGGFLLAFGTLSPWRTFRDERSPP